jgi:Integrase core domain
LVLTAPVTATDPAHLWPGTGVPSAAVADPHAAPPAADQATASLADPPNPTAAVAVPASQLLAVEMLRRPVESTQYTAIRFTQRLVDAGAQPSMGSVGDSYDNALAENFFSSLKVERVHRTSYRTREEAELDLVRWIDGWYNPRRIHASLAG